MASNRDGVWTVGADKPEVPYPSFRALLNRWLAVSPTFKPVLCTHGAVLSLTPHCVQSSCHHNDQSSKTLWMAINAILWWPKLSYLLCVNCHAGQRFILFLQKQNWFVSFLKIQHKWEWRHRHSQNNKKVKDFDQVCSKSGILNKFMWLHDKWASITCAKYPWKIAISIS